MLQYISQGNSPEEHLYYIAKVCKAGARWVQLRLKGLDLNTIVDTAKKSREICSKYGAILIINDSITAAKASNADGVHLGLRDESIKKARQILGPNATIGGTANTLNDCLEHAATGVSYIGLGPFAFTQTKKNLQPILGISGYQSIISAFKKYHPKVPVVAIGGVQLSDVKGLMQTGVTGIAVSGLLTNATGLTELIQLIHQEVDNFRGT